MNLSEHASIRLPEGLAGNAGLSAAQDGMDLSLVAREISVRDGVCAVCGQVVAKQVEVLP